ncbi:unnamed protein product [Arabis nemorensis]|uniref:Uncharacterized protein n=1 Tax=Arabis nemorensis TaxID=586526 RepID=A0A565BQL9_9BRAS|nr:unnamed protein product [Arabis nemorensis]
MMEISQARPSPSPEPPNPPNPSPAPSQTLSLSLLNHRLAHSAVSLEPNGTGSRWFLRCINGGYPSHYHLHHRRLPDSTDTSAGEGYLVSEYSLVPLLSVPPSRRLNRISGDSLSRIRRCLPNFLLTVTAGFGQGDRRYPIDSTTRKVLQIGLGPFGLTLGLGRDGD